MSFKQVTTTSFIQSALIHTSVGEVEDIENFYYNGVVDLIAIFILFFGTYEAEGPVFATPISVKAKGKKCFLGMDFAVTNCDRKSVTFLSSDD